MELRALNIAGATLRTLGRRELHFKYLVKPSMFGRQYQCLLRFRPRDTPSAYVLAPDLTQLTGDRALPHIYPCDLSGTKLCLWLPGSGEFTPRMRVIETFIPWTARWLDYFEDWLSSNVWHGGGEHPPAPKY